MKQLAFWIGAWPDVTPTQAKEEMLQTDLNLERCSNKELRVEVKEMQGTLNQLLHNTAILMDIKSGGKLFRIVILIFIAAIPAHLQCLPFSLSASV